MEEMNITNAKYHLDFNGNNTSVSATIDGEYVVVPLNAEGNRHYAEILRQVQAGTLTIADAE